MESEIISLTERKDLIVICVISYSIQEAWSSKNMERITKKVYKGTKENLVKFAENNGITLNRLVILALESYTGLTISRKTKPTDE